MNLNTMEILMLIDNGTKSAPSFGDIIGHVFKNG